MPLKFLLLIFIYISIQDIMVCLRYMYLYNEYINESAVTLMITDCY